MSLLALLMRRIPAAVAAAALFGAPLQTSAAERYPSHPVKIVVPFAAGGSIDFVARVAAKELSANSRAELRRREPHRRVREDWRRQREAGATRWIHVAAWHRPDAWNQSGAAR